MAQDRPVGDNGERPDRPTREQRLEAARAVVYTEEGNLIEPEEIESGLEAYGVTVGESEEGSTEYRDVPPELPLAACHLAVDTGRDPTAFLADTE